MTQSPGGTRRSRAVVKGQCRNTQNSHRHLCKMTRILLQRKVENRLCKMTQLPGGTRHSREVVKGRSCNIHFVFFVVPVASINVDATMVPLPQHGRLGLAHLGDTNKIIKVILEVASNERMVTCSFRTSMDSFTSNCFNQQVDLDWKRGMIAHLGMFFVK